MAMPVNSFHNMPTSGVNYNRENSLPTYEQATGIVPKDGLAEATPSAPPIADGTQQYYFHSDTTNHQSPNAATVPQAAYEERDVEHGLQDANMLQHEDPVVRQMAQTVIAECRRSKKRRERKAIMNAFGFVLVIVIILLFLAIKMGTNR